MGKFTHEEIEEVYNEETMNDLEEEFERPEDYRQRMRDKKEAAERKK